MTVFYKAGMYFYILFIRITSLFNHKAKLFIRGRKNWKKKLKSQIDKDANYLWFHCASLGEFEQGRPVIEEIRNRFPEYKIVLTFFSPSGFEIRKNYAGADIVSYLPVDTKRNAREFLEIISPQKAFFIKYEFWYFFISELKKQNIPLYILSAIFRQDQQFFKNTPWGKWYRKMLFMFEHLFIQNETSAQLLKTIGLSNFSVSGDTRFDRVFAIAGAAKEIPVVEKFRDNHTLIVAGSTWKPDEELLSEFINHSRDIKFIIAPHEVSVSNINRIVQLLKKPAITYSSLNNSNIEQSDVLIIDSIGLLSSLYQYGDIAYIGGGFGVGIHNILEAATFGMPIVFGPNFNKFKEAVDLSSRGGAFPVTNYDELKRIFNRLIDENNFRKEASETSKKYVTENVGSTEFIIKKVFNN